MSENVNQNQKLTSKQRRAIAALTAGQNYEQSALAAGVSTRTIARWREQEHFEDALQNAGQTAIGDASRKLTAGLDTAVDFLLAIIQDDDAPPSVRVRAALGLIDRQIRLKETTEIMTRLESLEQTQIVFRWSDNGH
jgi:hypothetical protein